MRRISAKICRFSLILVFAYWVTIIPLSAKEYHFVSIKGLVEQEVGGIVLPVVYEKLGHKAIITPMPGKRAEKEAVSGNADGEVMRIWSYGEENPALIRVPTPYYQLVTTVFVHKDSGVLIETRGDLAKYAIVKVRGVKHTNNITLGCDNVYDVEDTEQMMRFLRTGRADIALTNRIDGLDVLRKTAATDIVALPTPLAILDLYHYLHKKHAALVDEVDTVIREMIETGEMAKLIDRAESTVYRRP